MEDYKATFEGHLLYMLRSCRLYCASAVVDHPTPRTDSQEKSCQPACKQKIFTMRGENTRILG